MSLGGLITANGATGGDITIDAQTLSLAENISAQGTVGNGGSVDINVSGKSWETDGSRVDVSGVTNGGWIRHVATQQITTSGTYLATSSAGAGGNIDVSAWSLKALGATFDASGETGGGTIRLGGEYQGGKNLAVDELLNAHYLVLNGSTTLRANATSHHGNGGNIILWSDAHTLAYADISATPGLDTGTGGFVEISSGEKLTMGADVLTGIGSRTGNLLLDPKNITIADAATSLNSTALILGYGYSINNTLPLTSEPATNDYFASSVAISGTQLAVGAYNGDGFGNNSVNSGEVYLFSFDDTSFNGGKLVAMVGHGYTGGKNIDMSSQLGTSDGFGQSISLNNNRLAVGAYGDDGTTGSPTGTGAAYLFSFSDSEFSDGTLEATIGKGYNGAKDIDMSNLTLNDQFGYSVSLDGNRLAVSANFGDGSGNSTVNSGEVYLFTFSDSAFSGGALAATIGNGYNTGKDYDVSALAANDYFGTSISLNGNRLAVGAENDDGAGPTVTNSGVCIYSASLTMHLAAQRWKPL